MKIWLRYLRHAPSPKWPMAGSQIFLLLVALSAATANASTIVVNDASSGSVVGKCTIQDAVAAANTNAAVNACTAGSAGLDTIVFAPGITSIALATKMPGQATGCDYALVATEDLAIDGAAVAGSGVPKVTIARSSAAGTANFGVIGAPHLLCGPLATPIKLTLSGLTVSNGYNASTNAWGGGIAADILTIHDSVITSNYAGSYGGGIYVSTSLAMASSTVSNNSMLAGNGFGGGIYGDPALMTGGLTISSSTISGNTAFVAGGIYAPTMTIDNSTISANTADVGGGITALGITAYFVTVTANNGGDNGEGSGVRLENGGPYAFYDSVIAGNSNANGARDLSTQSPSEIAGTNNYIGSLQNSSGPLLLSALNSGVVIPSCASLGLGALANNGGGTQTHALLAGSCLIDAGGITSPSPTQLFAFDQRGSAFPRFVNTHADIGAFEYQAAPAAINGACGSDNGQTLLAAPVNLCSAGSASVVGGSGHPWSWTCAGTGGGSNANCTATIRTWTVTAASAGSGGSVSPQTQVVDNGASASVTASPASGYSLANASGCGSGTLSGNVYTTTAITANCAISVAFAAVPVTPSGTPVGAPTLSTWALYLLAVCLATLAFAARPSRRKFGG